MVNREHFVVIIQWVKLIVSDLCELHPQLCTKLVQ